MPSSFEDIPELLQVSYLKQTCGLKIALKVFLTKFLEIFPSPKWKLAVVLTFHATELHSPPVR